MLSTVPVTILHYSVCASNAVYSSCHHTTLQRVSEQCSLQFLSPYYITVCVPAMLSTVPVTYCITVCVPAMLSAVPVSIMHYSVCASNAVCSSCHHTALLCVCQQCCLQFLSPYCITVCVPAMLSAVPVTILHYSVCASNALYSSCHHSALQCVCQQCCVQFLSPYCITFYVPAMLSAIPLTILHYSVFPSNVLYSSCHHTTLQCVCQKGCLQFLSPYCITLCVPAMLATVPVTILHCSVCARNAVCSSYHHTALQCVCQQCPLNFQSPYCITVCVPAMLSTVLVTILHYSVCVPAMLSKIPVTILHCSVCASNAL